MNRNIYYVQCSDKIALDEYTHCDVKRYFSIFSFLSVSFKQQQDFLGFQFNSINCRVFHLLQIFSL